MRLVWCDLEMTGLDPERCAIIEMAVIVTDESLRPLAEFERVVWQPDEVLGRMEPFVRTMHTRNGLLEKVRASQTSLLDAERELMAMLTPLVPYGEGILAGNSIHTDRRFIARYMPVFDRYLNYRLLDVSSLKILAKAWYGDGMKFTGKHDAHTALADCRDSIAELEHYRANLLRKP